MSATLNDDVSVIIPTFNRSKFLERSVMSVVNQTVKPTEIIIVDDGSTDDTKSVVDRLINSVTDIRIIYTYQDNAGAGAARNTGVMNSSCKWIAFNDSDDEWLPTKLERQIEYSKLHPEYDMIYCSYVLIREGQQTVSIAPYTQDRKITEGSIHINLLVKNTIGTPTILMKKNDFEICGGFDSALKCIEDWDFVINFSKEHLIGYVDEVLVKAHRVDLSVSFNSGEFYNVRCRTIVENKDILIKNNRFDEAVLSLFSKAESDKCLKPVQQMFLTYLNAAH